MNQLQATPDFNNKVSKLEGFASRPTFNYEAATSYTWFWRQSLQIERVCQQADHQLWTSYKLHLISSTKCQIWKGQPDDHQLWASYKLHLILMTKSQNWKGLPASRPSIMNQLQATPDFINKVSNLKGSASRPADHELWASYKLHLILTTKSQNWKGLPAGRPSIMKQLQATPDFNDKVSKLEGSTGRPANLKLWNSNKLHLILTTKSPNWKGLPAGRPSIMKQLQATPDFSDKVSKLEGSAGWP